MEPITIKPNKTKIDEKLKNDLKILCTDFVRRVVFIANSITYIT